VCMLAILCKSSWVYFNEQKLQLMPQLHHSDAGWSVSLDKQMIFTKNMRQLSAAVQAWFGSLWIFSIEYPRALQKTCTFVEMGLLRGSGRMLASVKKWANRLLR